jgi:hypothetical protein
MMEAKSLFETLDINFILGLNAREDFIAFSLRESLTF